MALLYSAYPLFSCSLRQPGGVAADRAFLASFARLCLADPASARLITFDDLPDNSILSADSNAYAGFDWSPHSLYLNGADDPYPSGYQNGRRERADRGLQRGRTQRGRTPGQFLTPRAP